MATIVTRAGKGTPLTNVEVDANFTNLNADKLEDSHVSVTNSREWTATTVAQAEAEAGTATTRRAWTAQRVRQAIASWWGTISSTIMFNNAAQRLTKDEHLSGANAYHLELYSPDLGGTGEISLRFHQANRWYGQLRHRSDGFHFTDGASNTYKNIFFGTATGALTGNAATATALATARNINGTSFNGSAAITTANWGTSRTITIGGTGKAVNGSAAVTWATSELAAQTAVTLATARTINGTSFNGSAAITTANWGTGRTITLGPTGKTVNGSGNVTWTMAELGGVEASTVSTLVMRNSAGDIACRLVRPEYANGTTISGAMAFRVNNTTDNYIRFCSSPAAIRTWLGGVALLASPTFTGTLSAAYINSTSASGIRNQRAATQDAIRLLGRAGGTGSYVVTLQPATLTASRTVTFPNGNVVLTAGTSVITTRTITAGLGLTGGGDLSANRTINMVTTYGAIGTYAWVYRNGNGFVENTTVAGSALLPGGIQTSSSTSASADTTTTAAQTRGATALAGTWRIMSRANADGTSTRARLALVMRIS